MKSILRIMYVSIVDLIENSILTNILKTVVTGTYYKFIRKVVNSLLSTSYNSLTDNSSWKKSLTKVPLNKKAIHV